MDGPLKVCLCIADIEGNLQAGRTVHYFSNNLHLRVNQQALPAQKGAGKLRIRKCCASGAQHTSTDEFYPEEVCPRQETGSVGG